MESYPDKTTEMDVDHSFLHLERPVVFFDLETTGLSQETDRIVELYACKLFPDGSREDLHQYFNPTIPIPPEATAIHGITNEQVAGAPTFEHMVERLFDIFSEADLGGFNIRRFDVPFLMREFHRSPSVPMAQYRRACAATAPPSAAQPHAPGNGVRRTSTSATHATRNTVWNTTMKR